MRVLAMGGRRRGHHTPRRASSVQRCFGEDLVECDRDDCGKAPAGKSSNLEAVPQNVRI